ncbi:hypothetical protein DEO72_LG5g267 [Vigna unguiculata]|uniref:Uncharacterized protein n=1 Tax=Vigna unguiculata TaxID=3917 RepID=A0A4D6LW56_VIGUN|nr:hypothetical protein DEO72_LG5g267 [Vigna unguiculata]
MRHCIKSSYSNIVLQSQISLQSATFTCGDVLYYFKEGHKENELMVRYPMLEYFKGRLNVATAAPLDGYDDSDDGAGVLEQALNHAFEVSYGVLPGCRRCSKSDGSCWTYDYNAQVISCKYYCPNQHCSPPKSTSAGGDLWSGKGFEVVEKNYVWCEKGYVRRRLRDHVHQRCVGVRDDGCGVPVSCLCGAGKGTGLSIQCSLSVASDGCGEGNWNWTLLTNWGKELRDLGRVEKRWSGGEFSKTKNVNLCAGV